MPGIPKFSHKLEDKTSRRTLKQRVRPYFGRVQPGLSVGYRKRPGAGEWIARAETGRKMIETPNGPLPSYAIYKLSAPLGLADDLAAADGVTVLTCMQAKVKAQAWLRDQDAKTAAAARTGTAEPVVRTFGDMVETYRRDFHIRGSVDWTRAESALKNHLLPFFGNKTLAELTRADGELFIQQRQQEGAAANTIVREYGILARVLKLAVKHDLLDKNRLERDSAEMPVGAKRTRPASREEIQRILFDDEPYPGTSAEIMHTLKRAATVALHTGLREGKIVDLHRSWIVEKADGYWLNLPPPRSVKKGTPVTIPLTQTAYDVLVETEDDGDGDRCFSIKANALSEAWSRGMERLEIVDLRFHDLRHTCITALQNLHVDYEVRCALKGQPMKGSTALYSHGGSGFDQMLRDAVTKLELYWNEHATPPTAATTKGRRSRVKGLLRANA